MPKKYRSDALAAIHETMEALHEIGAVDKHRLLVDGADLMQSLHRLVDGGKGIATIFLRHL